MQTCLSCGATINADLRRCHHCGADSRDDSAYRESMEGERQPPLVGLGRFLRTPVFDFPTSRWYLGMILGYVAMFAGILLNSYVGDGALVSETFAWVVLGCSVLTSLCLFQHARETRSIAQWPRFYGTQYAVPLLNLITVPVFLIGRAEVQRFGASPFSLERIGDVATAPWASFLDGYRFLGVIVTCYLLGTFALLGPVAATVGDDNVFATAAGMLIWTVLGSLVVYRRYAPHPQKSHVDIACRDILIRLVTIPGITVLALFSVLGLFVPAVLVATGVGAFLPLALDGRMTDIVFASTIPFLLLPLSAVFVLVLRALPWTKALPILLEDVASVASAAVKRYLRALGGGGSDTSSRDWTLSRLVPRSGFAHTAVEITTESNVDLSMPGYFGYVPRTVERIQTTGLSTSRRLAFTLLIPGYLYSAIVFSYYYFRPDQAAAFAARLPASDALTFLLSYLGIPAFVVQEAIRFAGLPPATLSLGFVGLVVPSILLVPTAWHVALEYEVLLYRSLQRLGDENHLLLLWCAPVALPMALCWWKVRDTAVSHFSGRATSGNAAR